MLSKNNFICATEEYNTFEAPVPAHYFRKAFQWEDDGKATLKIAVCGFYELYFNGERITKGHLSPYISNTDDYIYYDVYTLQPEPGENVIGVILGNGFQNNPGGHVWQFDTAPFRSAPMLSLCLIAGDELLLCSGTDFKVAPSPIRSDDYRFGEHCDANFEIPGWNLPGFDDSGWRSALEAAAPKGELREADISPITKECELVPVEIIPTEGGYIYDFGQSNAGVCRLQVQGEKGQKIGLRHADALTEDGQLDLKNIWFPTKPQWERDKEIVHYDTYVCKGEGVEIYEPRFTYHGFRYVKVEGITPEQATKDLLTYQVFHTQLETMGGFACSDPVANTLQTLTRRSIVSNFHHFPTDCPQREKNGWAADAALIAETTLLNFDPERNYRQWLRNICKAQRSDGALPGIIPTTGWGFHWGNGPAWDTVLVTLPYYTYIYRGQTAMIIESAHAFCSYLRYLRSRVDEKGLLHIGLGDWCHVGLFKPKAPPEVTDTLMALDIADKIATMFEAVNFADEASFARKEAALYWAAFRKHLVDFETMTVAGECQSCQAMALHYGIFEESEEAAAFEKLLQLIHDQDDHMDVGVLGGRVLFHVLSRFGYSDLAYRMIVRPDYPSYGNWLQRGATTLWEKFWPTERDSLNHHFWGDISGWFIQCIAGIRLNPTGRDVNTVHICPNFIEALDHASAYHIAPAGKIVSTWKRTETGITLELEIPDNMTATAILPKGYRFENGSSAKIVTGDRYQIIR